MAGALVGLHIRAMLEVLVIYAGLFTVTSEETECIFYHGATFVTRCAKGCCDNKCCQDSQDSAPLIAGVAVAVFILAIAVMIGVVCLTRKRWKNCRCRKRPDTVDVDDESQIIEHQEPGCSADN